MRRIVASVLCALLAACNGGTGGGSSSAPWSIYNPVPVSIGANGLPSFTFPNVATTPDTGNLCPLQQGNAGPGLCFASANYLQGNSPTQISGTLRASWSISGDAGAVFDFHTNADNNCVGPPASVGLYFQKLYDPWNLKGFRYTSIARTPMALGAASISASLDDSSLWIDMIDGSPASQQQAAFDAAKKQAWRYGVVFGGGCYSAHGVFVDPPPHVDFLLTLFGMN